MFHPVRGISCHIAYNNVDNWNGTFDAASTHNLSGPGADAQIPAANARNGVAVTFAYAAGDDFHLAGGDTGALNRGTNLSADLNLPIFIDIDYQSRVPVWDIGADDANGTTAVKLMSFEAVPGDASVTLEWRTGSELDNLGFHVYRGPSADGPWTRLTSSLIPGLGFSPRGQAYSWQGAGLETTELVRPPPRNVRDWSPERHAALVPLGGRAVASHPLVVVRE